MTTYISGTFNMNTWARVKLSAAGKKRFVEIYGYDPLLENGYYRNQFWSIMRDFGSMLGMGTTPPFEDMNITVEPWT